LVHGKYAWTCGSGPGDPGELQPVDERTFIELIRWALVGHDDILPQTLAAINSSWFTVFSKPFVDWVAKLDAAIPLNEFSEIPLWEFRSIASVAGVSTLSPFHREFVTRSEYRFLWRIARLTGAAAAGLTNPVWLSRLRTVLEIFNNKNNGADRNQPRILSPEIRWMYDDQKIIARVPQQKCNEIIQAEWRISTGTWRALAIQSNGDNQWIDECKSDPLTSDDPLTVDLRLQTPAGPRLRRSFIATSNRMLFSCDGQFVEPYSHVPLGTYLLLTETVCAVPPGIQADDANQPAGWWHWRAVELSVNTPCRYLDVEFSETLASWEWDLEDTNQTVQSVEFADARRVFFGHLPKVRFRAPAEGLFRITHLSAPAPEREVTVDPEMQSVHLENALEDGKFYGAYQLTGIPSAAHSSRPTLLFLFLPHMSLRYIPSETFPEHAFDLEITARDIEIAPVTPDVIVKRKGKTNWLLHLENPFATAECAFAIKPKGSKHPIPLAVRLPANRLAMLGPAFGPVLRWIRFPASLSLTDVDWRSRMRIQFAHRTDGELLCRFSDTKPFPCGQQMKSWPNTYDVSLSTWRDRFGGKAQGLMEVRVNGEWLTLAVLTHVLDRAALVPITDTGTPALDHLQRLREGLKGDDLDILRTVVMAAIATIAADAACDALSGALASECIFTCLLLEDVDSARHLVANIQVSTEIADLKALRTRVALRTGSDHDAYWFNAERNSVANLPDGFHVRMARAELFYRIARLPGALSRVLIPKSGAFCAGKCVGKAVK
jgi:hypothetical protein